MRPDAQLLGIEKQVRDLQRSKQTVTIEILEAARDVGTKARRLERVAAKLDMLHYAVRLSDLKSPPGNRLEALKGKP